jgi:hypothetical protein
MVKAFQNLLYLRRRKISGIKKQSPGACTGQKDVYFCRQNTNNSVNNSKRLYLLNYYNILGSERE